MLVNAVFGRDNRCRATTRCGDNIITSEYNLEFGIQESLLHGNYRDNSSRSNDMSRMTQNIEKRRQRK